MSKVFVSSSCFKISNFEQKHFDFFNENKIFNIELSGNFNFLSNSEIKNKINKLKKKRF